jgi:hypothetical protein
LKELVELLNKEVFKSSDHYAYYFGKWRSETEYIFIHIFGEDSRELKKFEVAAKLPLPIGTAEQIRRQLPKDRRGTMLRAAREIEAILSIIKEYGLPEKRETPVPAQVFIAHGGKSAALDKLCSFIEALGVEPLVVEVEPSEGRLTEGQVNKYMKQADCAIILATYGHIEDVKTHKKHPRLNVVDELGRCRKVFPHRTILLLEKGVDLPSNDSGIIYEHFTKRNMENAFIKVAKELRAFGLIKAMKG